MAENFWSTIPRPILALAPMVGVSDTSFRQLCKAWGADVVYTEMISADALVHRARKAVAMMDFVPEEQPVVVQLMGKDPEVIHKAAQMVEARGAAGIDINFGCPAHKIAKNACGVMLMRDFDRSRAVIEAVLHATSLPVSIKVRVSIKPDSSQRSALGVAPITILEFLDHMRDLPVAAIMVHGRSFEDSFEGGVRAEMIKAVKEVFTKGPVLANGGITTVESAKTFLDQTGADGLGLARSVIGKPWRFKQIRDFLSRGTYDELNWSEVQRQIVRHANLFEQYRGTAPFFELRRHLSHYVRGVEHASFVRQQLTQVSSADEVQRVISVV